MPALFPPAIWTERPDVFGPTPLDRLVIGSDGRDQWARSRARGTHWPGRVTGPKESEPVLPSQRVPHHHPGSDAQLRIDLVQVPAYGPMRDEQALGYVLVGQAGSRLFRDLVLLGGRRRPGDFALAERDDPARRPQFPAGPLRPRPGAPDTACSRSRTAAAVTGAAGRGRRSHVTAAGAVSHRACRARVLVPAAICVPPSVPGQPRTAPRPWGLGHPGHKPVRVRRRPERQERRTGYVGPDRRSRGVSARSAELALRWCRQRATAPHGRRALALVRPGPAALHAQSFKMRCARP